MEYAAKGKIVELIYMGMPYSSQISALDLASEESAIRFTWRGGHYRVSFYESGGIGSVESVGDGVLIGDRESILIQSLLRRASLNKQPASAFQS